MKILSKSPYPDKGKEIKQGRSGGSDSGGKEEIFIITISKKKEQ